MGSTGNATGKHVHFEYYKGGSSSSNRANPREIINVPSKNVAITTSNSSSGHTHNYNQEKDVSYSYFNDVRHTKSYTKACSCGATNGTGSSIEDCTFVWKGLKCVCSKCGTEYVYHENNGRYVTRGEVEIYRGDNPDTGVIATIPSNIVLEVSDIKNSSWGRWIGKVIYEGSTGYVHLSGMKYNGTAGIHTYVDGVCTTCGSAQTGSTPGVYRAPKDITLYKTNVWSSDVKTVKAGDTVTISQVGITSYNFYWGYTPDGYVVGMDQLERDPASSLSTGTVATVPDGTYTIMSAANSGFCVDVQGGSNDNGAAIQIYTKNSSVAQDFQFTRNEDGTYTITNAKSGKVLTANGSGLTNGTKIIQYQDCTGQDQHWFIEENADGTVSFRNCYSNLYLDIPNATIKNSNELIQYQGNGSYAQKYYLASTDAASFDGNVVSVSDLKESYEYTGSAITPSLAVRKLACSLRFVRIPESGTATGDYCYTELCTVKAGVTYAVEVGSLERVAGSGEGATLLVHNYDTSTSVSEQVSYVFSEDTQIKTITPTQDGSLLLYANAPGSGNGNAIQANDVRVYQLLEEGSDYRLTCQNNVDAGTATATVEGVGAYSGTRTVEFVITPRPAPTIKRLAGVETAYQTSAIISKEAFPEGSNWVVLARDDDFADAMSATGLAGALDAPIVLTDRFGLSTEAADEIKRLGATSCYIIGGTGAMPGDFESQLAALGLTTVERVFGSESWDTSVACADKIAKHNGNANHDAIVAMSLNFQDALSISSFAYKYAVPIYLETSGFDGSARALPQAAIDGVAALGGTVYVAGGTGAVPAASVEGTFGADRIVRLAGTDGYDTSNQIATYMVQNGLLSADAICIACGAAAANGSDALSGAALAGMRGGVMLLVNGNDAMESVRTCTIEGFDSQGAQAFLQAKALVASQVYLLGGAYVVPTDLADQVEAVLGV